MGSLRYRIVDQRNPERKQHDRYRRADNDGNCHGHVQTTLAAKLLSIARESIYAKREHRQCEEERAEEQRRVMCRSGSRK